MPFIDYSGFADNDADAERRFQKAKEDDPFPEITDALLNSADISDYVRMTGMLYPFHLDKVKSGSYEAAIHGRCIWWNEEGEWQEKLLSEGKQEKFILKANSIAFVQVEPFFRLPDYIALRFNLKITHVHRGILLGTGPLIDPGFEGELLIPLHNLTTNDYPFKCSEGLIWIEFTKASRLPGSTPPSANSLGLTRRGKYISFPSDKKKKKPEYYLSNASPHSPIRSSIPESMRKSETLAIQAATSADKALQEAERARKTVFTITGIAAIGLLVALVTLGFQTWDLIQNTWKIAGEVERELREDIERDQGFQKKAEDVEKQIQFLEKRVIEEVNALKAQVNRPKQASENRSGLITGNGKKEKPGH
ncbi:MAG: hypothetical protein ACREJU_19895 [Nitrospiraceae bacterium]